ncbi:MAG: membrane protein insertion efficiency factor YidD [Desulfobacteraceae bacterium]
MAGQPKGHSNTHSSAWTSPVRFFQKYISKADGDRCPMYPSCSHYASQAIQRHGAIKGWIIACDRLLRCGHDEVHLAPKVRVKGKVRSYDPLEANTRWWSKP